MTSYERWTLSMNTIMGNIKLTSKLWSQNDTHSVDYHHSYLDMCANLAYLLILLTKMMQNRQLNCPLLNI